MQKAEKFVSFQAVVVFYASVILTLSTKKKNIFVNSKETRTVEL